jgi:hypothetical protein
VSARKLKIAPNKWARSKKVPEVGEEERRMPLLFPINVQKDVDCNFLSFDFATTIGDM